MNPNNTNEVELVVSKKKVFIFLLLLIPFALMFIFALYYFFAGSNEISDVKVTNLSSNSATITWTTEKASKGSVLFSKENSFPFYAFLVKGDREISFDDRDIKFNDDGSVEYDKEIAEGRVTHHVTLRNLEEGSEYFFRIKDKFGFVNDGVISFTTFYEQEAVNIPDPIYGTVTSDDEKVSDGIVFFKVMPRVGDGIFTSSNWYSAALNSDGGWSGDISNLVNILGIYIQVEEDSRDLVVYVKSDKGDFEETTIPLTLYKPLANLEIE